jgi:PAT family beta-lactamase induction signal transducer AmpG
MAKRKSILSHPSVWGFTTYFAEGFPYTIIRTVSSVFFRDMKVSLEAIGLTSFFGLPWVIKFLWGPQVDEYGTKRSWMLITQSALACLVLVVALLVPVENSIPWIAMLFFVGAFLAATHDISIDGYYMEALSKEEQAEYVGFRVMAYRIAMMTGTGVIVTIGTTKGWNMAFGLASAILFLLFAYHLFFLPKVEKTKAPLVRLLRVLKNLKIIVGGVFLALFIVGLKHLTDAPSYKEWIGDNAFLRQFNFTNIITLLLFFILLTIAVFRKKIKARLTRSKESFYAKAFVSFMDQDGITIVLLFIIFMRTGEFMLSAMVSPFIVDLGLKMHYGWISSGVGLPCSIVGAMIGGYCIGKFGMRKVFWPFLLAQNLTNVVYMVLAWHLKDIIIVNTANANPISMGLSNLVTVAGVHGIDQIAGGLGSSVLTIFLMRLCKIDFKAAHYAIGSGLMSLSGMFAGAVSGVIAAAYGYWILFGISFAVSLPGMVFAFFVPLHEKK